jgi:hypothetical protein
VVKWLQSIDQVPVIALVAAYFFSRVGQIKRKVGKLGKRFLDYRGTWLTWRMTWSCFTPRIVWPKIDLDLG